MASLREIKDRISSVKSTLKITSAMKLVASSKLRKAQKTIETMRPYESALNDILGSLGSKAEFVAAPLREGAKVAVVAVSSNSSLCGGFNTAVIKKTLSFLRDCGSAEVYAVGRKMAETLRREGYPSPEDYMELIAHPSYDRSCALAQQLVARYAAGELSRIVLIYSHFVNAAKQVPVVETLLPFTPADVAASADDFDFIVEPGRDEVASILLPQVLMLKFHAAILDSAAAEHAARTLAMQTATDNAQDLMGSLTLEYNKGRQQKITAEILDLLGGAGNQ